MGNQNHYRRNICTTSSLVKPPVNYFQPSVFDQIGDPNQRVSTNTPKTQPLQVVRCYDITEFSLVIGALISERLGKGMLGKCSQWI